MSENQKRFIEEFFPIKEVSIESAREKNIHSAGISTIHNWWARRPLSSSRVTNFAALVNISKKQEEINNIKRLIIELSNYENINKKNLIDEAKKIINSNYSKPPKVIDPFGGSGSIPLEALRLGCETYSNDYNPVAVLIQKCVLEYPQRYGKSNQKEIIEDKQNKLTNDIKKWASWIQEQIQKELGFLYPIDEEGYIPLGYIWAKTINCQNPKCGIEIPLLGNYWLCKKENRKISLMPIIEGNQITFKIVGDGYTPIPPEFDPNIAMVRNATVECPACKSIIAGKNTRKLFQEGHVSQKMIAVVSYHPQRKGKKYSIPNDIHYKLYQKSEELLESEKVKYLDIWGCEPVPDEPTPDGRGRGAERAFSLHLYNLFKWGDLFNARQKLVMIHFTNLIRRSYEEMTKEGYDHEYAKIISCYLAFILDKVSNYYSTLSRWKSSGESVGDVFSRPIISMIYDYVEGNPISGTSGSWNNSVHLLLKTINFCSNASDKYAIVTQASATELPYQNEFFDAVFTDPPYYDNIPYSYLSDYFYVWLKRSIGQLYPELFSTPLTPKNNEIVAYSNKEGGFEAGKKFFENMLKKSFKEMHRVLKTNGIAIIVYAHKSTEGWETLINSLLDSNLVITGAWPINTEMKGRFRAMESAALASSIYIIARKIKRQPIGFYNEVKEELVRYLEKKMKQLWDEGISGADFFISAIGSALAVFGKYEKVMDYEGNIIRADRFLEDIRIIVTNYSVKQILHNGFANEISDLTRFYVLWRWNYGDGELIFDEANKLARGCNISLDKEWSKYSFIKKSKDRIRVLGPKDRKLEEIKDSKELIDIIHKVLLYWEKGQKEEIAVLLNDSGYGKSDIFYRVAQAISETLPNETKEKKLLDGFLAGRERVKEEVKEQSLQTPLFLEEKKVIRKKKNSISSMKKEKKPTSQRTLDWQGSKESLNNEDNSEDQEEDNEDNNDNDSEN